MQRLQPIQMQRLQPIQMQRLRLLQFADADHCDTIIMFWNLFRVCTGSETFRRNMAILESFEAFGGAELHIRVRCLAIDGDLLTIRLSPYFDTRYSFALDFQCHRSQVNQHPVAEVMPILLKSGQSASREEAAQKRKSRRSMQHSPRRSMEIPDSGPSIVDGYAFYTLSFPLFLLGEKGGTPIRVLLELHWFSYLFHFSFYIYSSMISKTMKIGFLGPSRKEPAGLCTIRKSTREVSIDTLQAASIDSVSRASNDTIHHVLFIINTIHPSTVHRDTIHRDTIYLPSIDTVYPVSVDTIHVPSIDTVHPVSVDTIHLPSIDTVHPVSVDTIHLPSIDTVHIPSLDIVHPNTVHRDTVHPNTVHRNTIHRDIVPPMTNTTYGETKKVEALILKIDKKGIWRDEKGRPCNLTGQLINAEGSVIPDVIAVAETNTFNLTSQWYDWGSEDPFCGLPHEDPKDLIKRLPLFKLQTRSLTCWEDIKEAFIGKFFSEAVETRSKRLYYMIKEREKGIMISMSQIIDFIYSEENGDIGTPTTHVKQPDIQVHHADESKQKDELNREKLVNHDTVEDDEYHVSGEQSKHRSTVVTQNRSISALQKRSIQIFFIDRYLLQTLMLPLCMLGLDDRRQLVTITVLRTPMLKDDEQHVSGELSRLEEVDISDMSSEPIDTPTSTSIDIPTVMIDPSLQTSIDTNSCCRSIPLGIPEKSSCPQDIADSTLKSIDVSSCYPDQKVEKEITMEDFLELEEFLELEHGQQLGDLDLSEEVTMKDFLELEE
ncbi:hypothetical protein IGI04_036160 [Brassica rapa subsp. trilocularis]|uniref:Retrotransposon gag domain-containing protein n=1 Tax=Brassica rapa subsp. trilocularis TaxID=1813537 RepID=A0ABQ7LDQ1_BRACM|nr:hypothetical protein IGI04_036160 [Brassica rapa subsp. trilocularis]